VQRCICADMRYSGGAGAEVHRFIDAGGSAGRYQLHSCRGAYVQKCRGPESEKC
jgi:hypothetical protein